ncbi:MAG: hypothetical protein HYZ13_08240 [Acidobacteria bacterium]|nr:hypothetical protein [Acidobacteriota bacterium]
MRLLLPCLLPALLAAAPQAPAPLPERELTFPGFNGAMLKGSVLKGGAHPYFVVMVAGSGPTDRDWSTKLLPKPSHGGRDLARWFQKEGLGSLRFDKRFIGAWDPKMDISLEAQAGDVKAAVDFARKLPEARGKRILLLGHSEGCLVSLVAATDAEALLLAAPPQASMGRTILAQVRRQLAGAGADAEATQANLGHLERVFEAIRRGEGEPVAGSGVAPGVVALGKGLMFGVNRPFVKATLDLDPWLIASRCTGRLAALWAEADVQCPKPAEPPAGFRGETITIPGANHLLKRETRDLAALDGPKAAETYGDDTPMADLAPLAAWLKALR